MSMLVERLARYGLGKSDRARAASVRYVVRQAAAHVPFYRDLYDAEGVRADHVRSPEDLARLPIVSRVALLRSGHAGHLRLGAAPEKLIRRSTSGTSGEPLTIFMSGPEMLFRKITMLDSFRRVTKLQLPLRLVDVGAYKGGSDLVQRLGLVQIERLYRNTPIEEQAQRLSCLRPHIVEGRPSSLWALAREAGRQGLSLPRPRVVITFGETLHHHVRQAVAGAFGCRLIDCYNCEEVGSVAWECPSGTGRMHLNPDTAVVEIVDDDGRPLGPGELGRVLLTNLYNVTMPFIRYEIMDRAALEPAGVCACGFEGPSMRLIEGRDEDFFTLPDGRELTPREANDIIYSLLPGQAIGNDLFRLIERFQVVQEAVDRVVVRVAPGPDYDPDLLRDVDASARRFHPDLRARVELVPSGELEPTSKYKDVVSHVPRRGRVDLHAERSADG